MIRKTLLILLLAVPCLHAYEFTIKRTVIIEETGYSANNDPVEALEMAVLQAKKQGASLIAGQIKGGSTTINGVLSSDWVEKRANIQIFDVKILEKQFVSPGEVKIKIRLVGGYLDLPKFWNEYYKTVPGSTLRTMAIPGFGQYYNREYFSAGLYGVFYWTFYLTYISELNKAKTEDDVNAAFVTYQVPSLVFWTLAVSDAGISRLMMKFGLEQIKESYRAQSGPTLNHYALTFQLMQERF